MTDELGDDDFGFGDGGFCKLYGDRLADSSLLECAVASRWIFLYMLARADSVGRFRCATVAGLARAAAVSLADAERAVAELEAPDPDSSSPDQDGRRIVRFPGGWQIVTYAKYRDYRTKKQIEDAKRQREYRERQETELAALRKGSRRPPQGPECDMSRDVTVTSAPDVRRQTLVNGTEASAVAPVPASVVRKQTHGGNGTSTATAREMKALEADPILAGIGDAWATAFGRSGRELGVLRAARIALAGGYSAEALGLVVRVVAQARKTPQRFPERGSVRWAVERGKLDPAYLFRPSTLDRLIPEAERFAREAESQKPKVEARGPVFAGARSETA